MPRIKETLSESPGPRCHFRAVLPGIVLSILVSGCNPQATDDSDINALAATWPEYRAPNLDASMNMNLWPGGATRAQATLPARGTRPEVDRPLPVIKSHRYWSLEETAIDSLARIGEPAVPELVKALRHAEPRVRYQAAQVLGRIGPEADMAVAALIRVMDDPEPQVRKAAVRALGQIGPEASDAVRPLMNLINAAGGQRPAIPAEAP